MKQLLFFLSVSGGYINLIFIILGIAALFGIYKLFKLLDITWIHILSVVLSIVVMLFVAVLLQIVTVVLLDVQKSGVIALISLSSLFISYGVIFRFLTRCFKKNK